jgi:hypothetical protein
VGGEKPAVLTIHISSSGAIRLDGREVNLSELETALREAKLNGSTVQYSREHPESDAPPVVDAVMKMITANRLRIALAVQPDRPSNVIDFPGIEAFFAKVRRRASGHRGVLLVTPDQVMFGLPAPPQGAINAQMEAGVRSLVPSDQPRSIAAIAASGALAGDPSTPPVLPEIAKKVPFFGLLIGLAYVGHTVWIFEGNSDTMPVGCEDADVLIVDGSALTTLPKGWADDAAVAMRNANILVFDRTRARIGALRTAGEVPGRVEFSTG